MPLNLSANIQYGASVIAHVVHFSAAQYIPYNRIVEIMKNTFNLSISEGSIHNILTQFSTEIAPAAYEEIRSDIAQSAVVGGDETGIRVNGKNAWLFTVQTEKATFLFAKESRGFQSLKDEFPEGFPEAIYVSDCLPAQIKVAAKGHQICIAHLLRELENFKVAFACNFATRFQSFFRDTIKMGHRGKNVPISEVYELEARLDALLAENLAGKYHKTQAFQSRLIKYRDYILTFLYHERVPPDNNGSERSIRTAKVKMKVSGGFRTMQGAQNFAILRSIIDSAKKNGLNAFDAIFNLVKNHAFA
jgi:transposase-like protein